MNRTAWQVIACITALILFSTSSRAQPPATSFDELRRVLRGGQEVVVTDVNGRQTRNVVATVNAAQIVLLSKSILTFRRLGPPRQYVESQIAKVARVDSVWNGALIGYAAGFGLGVASCKTYEGDCAPFFSVAGLTLIGGALGATIDAAIRKTVYLNGRLGASGRVSLSVSPLLGTGKAGAQLKLHY